MSLTIDLTSLHILKRVRVIEPKYGQRTCTSELQSIFNITTTSCKKIAYRLQKFFSNKVAENYQAYSEKLPNNTQIHGFPLAWWSKYIQKNYRRTDKRGVNYTPCVFSMQIALAYLISSRSTIAIVYDQCSPSETKNRSIYMSAIPAGNLSNQESTKGLYSPNSPGKDCIAVLDESKTKEVDLVQKPTKAHPVTNFKSEGSVPAGIAVYMFRGDGKNDFIPIDLEKITHFEPFDAKKPLIIFNGYSFLKDENVKSQIIKLKVWLHRFQNLVLACDVNYPQFPQVSDDPLFDNTPIIPQEEAVRVVIENYSNIQGVSAMDPSFFCLSHIYPASLGQVLKVFERIDLAALPKCFDGQHMPSAMSC